MATRKYTKRSPHWKNPTKAAKVTPVTNPKTEPIFLTKGDKLDECVRQIELIMGVKLKPRKIVKLGKIFR